MLLPFDSSSDEEDLPRPRVFRPRNMVEHHREVDVPQHFRLPTEAIKMLAARVNDSLRPFYNARSTDLTPSDQLSIALTYYATGTTIATWTRHAACPQRRCRFSWTE